MLLVILNLLRMGKEKGKERFKGEVGYDMNIPYHTSPSSPAGHLRLFRPFVRSFFVYPFVCSFGSSSLPSFLPRGNTI